MSPGHARIVDIAALLLIAGLIDAAQGNARAAGEDEFTKSCISGQASAPENKKLNSATIARYCKCVTKHSFEVISAMRSPA
jgi:hypothetical protein